MIRSQLSYELYLSARVKQFLRLFTRLGEPSIFVECEDIHLVYVVVPSPAYILWVCAH